MKKLLFVIVLLVLLSVLAVSVNASQSSLLDTVRNSTGSILGIVKDTPSNIYDKVSYQLQKVVRYELVSRRIAGKHYRKMSHEQRQRFQIIVHNDLVRLYTDSFMKYKNYEFEIDRVEYSEDKRRQPSKVYLVLNSGNKNFSLVYYLTYDDKWFLDNIVIENLNLTALYREKFNRLMKENRGDVDRVLDRWNSVPLR